MKNKCHFCQIKLRHDVGPDHDECGTMTFRKPLAEGGKDEPGNVVLCCRGCKLRRAHKASKRRSA